MNNDVLSDQTPPQNIEAEKAVLGAAFLSGDALVEAMEYVQPEDFYRRAHQIIFQKMEFRRACKLLFSPELL